jgi:hypothetical protein
MDKSTAVTSPVIEKKMWRCELHWTECTLGSPCYECKREVSDPGIIESEFRTPDKAKIREKNSQPRLRL